MGPYENFGKEARNIFKEFNKDMLFTKVVYFFAYIYNHICLNILIILYSSVILLFAFIIFWILNSYILFYFNIKFNVSKEFFRL